MRQSQALLSPHAIDPTPMRAYLLVLLMLTINLTAYAEQPLETDESCARIEGLLSASEIQTIVGKKATLRPVEVTYARECTLEIDLEGITPDKAFPIAPLALKIKQHPTFAIAKSTSLRLVKSPEKLANTDRSFAAYFVFGYPYVTVVVDGAEMQVFTRRKEAMSNDQLKDLGLKLHQNALHSKRLAQHSQSGQEVTAYRVVGGIIALRDRCLQSDIKSSATVKRVFEESTLKDIKLPALGQLSTYAQSWIQIAKFDEENSRRSQMIKAATASEIEPECSKMAAELNEFAKTLPTDIMKQFSVK
jgi:hypothetical protein